MADQQPNQLPSEVQEMPQDAQNIFMAAYSSAHDDGMSEEAAMDVAWNSVTYNYAKGEDGIWQRKPQDNNIHYKAIPSGGN